MKIRETELNVAMQNGERVNQKETKELLRYGVYCSKPFVRNFVGFIYIDILCMAFFWVGGLRIKLID